MKFLVGLSLCILSLSTIASDNTDYIVRALSDLNLPTDLSKDASYQLSSPDGDCNVNVEVKASSKHPRLEIYAKDTSIAIFKKTPSLEVCSKGQFSTHEMPKFSSCVYDLSHVSSSLSFITDVRESWFSKKHVSLSIHKAPSGLTVVTIHRTGNGTGWTAAYAMCSVGTN